MRVDLYTTCWNEERMIPFFLRHYEPLVDRIVVFDDGSTDRSCELFAECKKAEVKPLDSTESVHITHIKKLDHCWKESRGQADWVVIADIDEHFFHPEFRDYLQTCTYADVTILDPIGYDMISMNFPAPGDVLWKTIRRGCRTSLLDKKGIFDPDAINEINYNPGRHTSQPVGNLVYPGYREMLLLHYRHLGLDYTITRTAEMKERIAESDLEKGWGLHHFRSDAEVKGDFDRLLAEAEDVSLDLQPFT